MPSYQLTPKEQSVLAKLKRETNYVELLLTLSSAAMTVNILYAILSNQQRKESSSTEFVFIPRTIELLLRHRLCTTELLTDILLHNLFLDLLSSPKISSTTIDFLLDDKQTDMVARDKLLRHPNCSQQQLLKYYQTETKFLKQVPNSTIFMQAILSNPNCPHALLRAQAEQQFAGKYCEQVYANPKCPSEILAAALEDNEKFCQGSKKIQKAILSNPNCPQDKLLEAYARYPELHYIIYTNANCPVTLLHQLWNKRFELPILIFNPGCPKNLLLEAIVDKKLTAYHKFIMEHPKITLKHLTCGVLSPDPETRALALLHPQATPTLRLLHETITLLC